MTALFESKRRNVLSETPNPFHWYPSRTNPFTEIEKNPLVSNKLQTTLNNVIPEYSDEWVTAKPFTLQTNKPASDSVYNILVGYPLDAPNDDETAETANKRIKLRPKRRHKVPKYYKEDFPFPFVRPFQRKMGTSLGLDEKIGLGDGNSPVVERLFEVCLNYLITD